MVRFVSMSVLLLVTLAAVAQQQSRVFADDEGNKTIFDVNTGWKTIEKNGATATFSVTEVTEVCDYNERFWKADQPDDRTIAFLCDEWWKLQPQNKVEQVPFATLVRRLLLQTRESTNFVRYRGMELKSTKDSTIYDAAIIPNDIGSDMSCTIEEENRHELGMMYSYRCEIKTTSFPAALQLQNKMVLQLKEFNLKEDEVREHGLGAYAREIGVCAPTGECLEQHVFATTMQSWKMLQIAANPILVANTIAELQAGQNGKHAPAAGIATDKGIVSFEIFSVGPRKTS